MGFSVYIPTFRGVLLLEVKEQKTEGGIYIPSTDFLTGDAKKYEVIRTGPDCTTGITSGDRVRIMRGIIPEVITIYEQGVRAEYLQVPEQQIIGIEKKE